MSWFYIFGFIFALISIFSSFFYIYFPLPWTQSHQTKRLLQWLHNDSNPHHMTEFLSSLRYPVILTNTPFDHVNFSQWTFRELGENVRVLSCKTSTSSLFQYHAVNQPLDIVEEFSVNKTYQDVVITGHEFFQEIQSPSQRYFYASGGVELLSFTTSLQSISNITFPPHEGSGQVNYWFGSANVTAYTHYDTSHNLHYVIKGKKKFLLFPPSSHHDLKLYPSLHSLYRQTQLDVLGYSGPQPSLILDVLPGNALYLPPYWFHCVITVLPSISLNIWSDSQDYLLMETILNAPIPFDGDWNHQTLMRAAKYFIANLIEQTQLTREFVKLVLFPRYEGLLQNISSDDCTRYHQLVQEYCHVTSLPSSSLSHISKRASLTSKLFLDMSSVAVKEINMANYIEQIGYTILRENVIQLPFFLQECF